MRTRSGGVHFGSRSSLREGGRHKGRKPGDAIAPGSESVGVKAPLIDYFLAPQGPLQPGDAAAAIIVLDDGRYVLQLRDQKPGIFYPGHWGLFGGAIDPAETPEEALRRELREETGLVVEAARVVTEFTYTIGRHGRIARYFYEVPIRHEALAKMELREGSDMRPFSAAEILTKARVVPYDSFALWLHASGAWLEPFAKRLNRGFP
jgi:8-oxo-dGTP pyrophosphatase MutT (NUDIX family)